jgi:transcriptional regulator with XRE-family HTH domain
MWLDNIDIGGRGIVQPAKGPLGRALRSARHDLFLSQQALADLAGVSQSAVSRLERGRPSWSLFCQVVEAIGGRPTVAVERVLSSREIMNIVAGGGELPVDPDADTDDWW